MLEKVNEEDECMFMCKDRRVRCEGDERDEGDEGCLAILKNLN